MRRLLLDEGVPRPLARRLQDLGGDAVYFPNAWKQLDDGSLIRRAIGEGFGIFVTNDRNMPYQKILSDRSIAVLVLPTLRLPETLAFAPQILLASHAAPAGVFTLLTADGRAVTFDAKSRKS